MNPNDRCAPELGIITGCPTTFDPITPGLARTAHVDYDLAGPIIQVRFGGRTPLASGDAITLSADTSVSGNSSVCAPAVCPDLSDTGVPFVYVDQSVRNNFRYFYAVTAFDINSFQSGPSSIESARTARVTTPRRAASNYENTATLDVAVYGCRGFGASRSCTKNSDNLVPSLDPGTGLFSKPWPASSGWSLGLAAFVKQVIAAPGAVTARLDSLALGSAYSGVPVTYYVTIETATDTTALVVPMGQNVFNLETDFATSFVAVSADNGLAARYGGSSQYTLAGSLSMALPGNYYTSAYGRGCINDAPGFQLTTTGCDYNGARWFDGPSPAQNETVAHPNGCSNDVNSTNFVTCYSDAGGLTGVANVFEVKSYHTTPNVWRNVEGVLGGAVRAADYNVYWSSTTAGLIDSVIDGSNNVVVPFDANRLGSSWGILNQAAATVTAGSYDQRSELTINDFGCVPPLKGLAQVNGQLGCGAGPTYLLSQTAVPGPIVFWSGPTTNARAGCGAANGCGFVAANAGFAMYMPGHLFMFELTGGALPATGTVWSLRDYTGAVRGGGTGCATCGGGDDGPYSFFAVLRPMAAGGSATTAGAEVRFSYDVVNQVNPPTDRDLSNVHTVPDPYYVTNEFETSAYAKVTKFVNLPQDAIIRIYSSSGVLLRLLEHHSNTFGGDETWDVRNRNNQVVASGVYFFHVEAGNARRVGRFTIVNFAQ